MVLVLWHQGITIRTILSRRPSSGPALACTPLSPVFGSDAKPSAAPPPKCSCTAAPCLATARMRRSPPCQSARIFCRTLPGCAAVGFVAPIICSTHAHRQPLVPVQPPHIRKYTDTGGPRSTHSPLPRSAGAVRCRSVRAVPMCRIAANQRRTFSRKSFHAAAWLPNSTSSRRPKQRGERRCLCTGRRELLAHRHVEP